MGESLNHTMMYSKSDLATIMSGLSMRCTTPFSTGIFALTILDTTMPWECVRSPMMVLERTTTCTEIKSHQFNIFYHGKPSNPTLVHQLNNSCLIIVVAKVQFVVPQATIVVAISPIVEVVPVSTQGRRPSRRPLFPASSLLGIVRPSVVAPVLPIRVHVLAAAAPVVTVSVPVAVLTEAQGILLPSPVETGADGDVMRPLEARGLETDVNLMLWDQTSDGCSCKVLIKLCLYPVREPRDGRIFRRWSVAGEKETVRNNVALYDACINEFFANFLK